MFDQVLAENTARTRRPVTVALSFSGQLLLVGLAVLLPVLHTEGINVSRTLRIVTAPRPLGERIAKQQPVSVAPVRTVSTARPVFSTPVLREPAHVPNAVLMEPGEPPSSFPNGPAGPVAAGDSTGVFGSIGDSVPPPPKLAPPKPVQQTPPPARGPMKVGGIVQAAKLLNQVKPAYPPLARQARISGLVRLEAIIGRNGTIQSLQVMSGHPMLVDAALAAVRQWSYRPTLLNGEPVEVLTQIDVHFILGQ